MSDEVEAIGWEAIDGALEQIYGDQEPMHYASSIPYMLGGNDPLNGISVYRAQQPLPHWHFVTYGFSDLYEKETDDPDYSGYGFELTLRLVRQPDEQEPPAWTMNLLQNLARYVFSSGNIFRNGDHMDANGPIMLGSDTKLTALGFITDPELKEMDTPNGKVEFIQVVGITADELQVTQEWNTLGLLHTLAEYIPSYLTDLGRDSILTKPAALQAVQEGSEREGSSTGFLFVDQLGWETLPGQSLADSYTLTLGAKQAEVVGKLLRRRILHNRSLTLVSSGLQVILEPGEQPFVTEENEEIHVQLNEAAVNELAELLQPIAGTVRLSTFPKVQVQVVQTHIKDTDGNVVQTIG